MSDSELDPNLRRLKKSLRLNAKLHEKVEFEREV
jgi:hypothetical protein